MVVARAGLTDGRVPWNLSLGAVVLLRAREPRVSNVARPPPDLRFLIRTWLVYVHQYTLPKDQLVEGCVKLRCCWSWWTAGRFHWMVGKV